MPPRLRPPGPAFRPPSNWRVTYRRLERYRLSLPQRETEGTSSWWRNTAGEIETHRFHVLVGLMLSALARDVTCAPVMNAFVRDGLTPQSVQRMTELELRERIKTISLCNTKARHIKQVADILVRDYEGKVPHTYEELIAFPGVGPKMANLFFLGADNRVVGIGVDTHVHRISQRLGWVPPTVKSPEDTRKCLESWLPRELWSDFHFHLVNLGQLVCRSRHPKCEVCCVRDLCPSAQLPQKKEKRARHVSF